MSPLDRLGDLDAGRVIGVGLKVALVLVLIPFVIVAVPQVVGASNSFIILSNSMADDPAPNLYAGDVVFVYQTAPSEIETGDVITFHSGEGQITTHRVVDVVMSGGGIAFETKGDTNEEADAGMVSSGQVIGTVRFSVPWIGRVVAFAGTQTGLVLLVIVPSALLILSEVVNISHIVRGSSTDATLGEDSQGEPAEDIHE